MTYARWVKSFNMIDLKKTIKDMGRWKTKIILKRYYDIDISESSIMRIIKIKGLSRVTRPISSQEG